MVSWGEMDCFLSSICLENYQTVKNRMDLGREDEGKGT